MPSQIFSIVTAPLVLLTLYKVINLWRYLQQAKETGLPYVLTPVLETEVLGLLATPLLRWIYHDYLNQGKSWPRWCRFMIKDWSWEDKRLTHDQLGDVFLCVSPEGLICYSADAAMGWDVMNRRNDFTKPRDKYSKWRFTPAGYVSSPIQSYWNHTVQMLLRQKGRRIAFTFV